MIEVRSSRLDSFGYHLGTSSRSRDRTLGVPENLLSPVPATEWSSRPSAACARSIAGRIPGPFLSLSLMIGIALATAGCGSGGGETQAQVSPDFQQKTAKMLEQKSIDQLEKYKNKGKGTR